jgi:choline dehydrogenase
VAWNTIPPGGGGADDGGGGVTDSAGSCYDVVIVGAESAGCVLAARLSEDPSRRVLLLEAGPDYPPVESHPADIADGGTLAASHDWGYSAEPAGLGPGLALPRGKLVGGSSAVNACFALRGSPADHDGWAEAGNEGWSFDEVLPAFRSVEQDLDFGDRRWHGDSGPLLIRRYAEAELTPIQHGRRISSALAFLTPARHQSNFELRPDVLVDRVEISRGRAVAVHLASPSDRIEAGMIVLAAGAYGSAPLLLRSGVGPSDELRQAGIHPNLDLPGVGRGLVDHPGASLDVVAPPDSPTRPVYQSVVTLHSRDADQSGASDLQLFAAGSWEYEESPTGSAPS